MSISLKCNYIPYKINKLIILIYYSIVRNNFTIENINLIYQQIRDNLTGEEDEKEHGHEGESFPVKVRNTAH